MIVVHGVIESTVEDIATMQEAIAIMEAASRAEPGCHDYTLSVELNNPGMLRITEKWDCMEDLQAHFKTPHMAAFQQAIGATPPSSMQVTFYQAEEVKFG